MVYTFDLRKINRKNKRSDPQSSAPKKTQLPNSLVARIMEEPAAEKEADQLSRGITSSTPEDVMREMGSRLGADFSGVRFHSDSLSMNRGQALGARAWAQGSDVYFGKGGFDPSVAAHELVHTIQQGAVHGTVSQSMPMGAVQMLPNKDDSEDDGIKPNHAMKEEDFQRILTQIFSTDMGSKVYKRMEKTLKEMINKGAGKKPPYTKEKGIEFLSLAAGRDYGAKGILSTIIQKDITSKDAAKDAAFEYEELIKMLSQRLGAYGLEDVAMQTQLINRPPKYEHNGSKGHKRAYETDMPADAKDGNVFNPNNIPELTKIQKQIDHAGDAKTAYKIFAAYTGNPAGKYNDKYGSDPDINLLKKKLKHMTRVIYDYPELRNNIGDMQTIDPKVGRTQMMSVDPTVGGRDKAIFNYNAYYDREGADAEQKRNKDLRDDLKVRRFNAPNYDFAGTHEMGHVLASLLLNSGDRMQDLIDENSGKHEDSIIKEVIENKNVLTPDQKKDIKFHKKNTKFKNYPLLKGQIDTQSSKLYENGLTSKYGAVAPVETFAEAFHDVYANGKNAKPFSVEIVKEYEKRQEKLTKDNFAKKKRSVWRRIADFFKF